SLCNTSLRQSPVGMGEKCPRFEAEDIQVSNRTFARYTIQSPKIDNRTLVLVFDESGRLAERQWISARRPGDKPDVYQRHTFSDYHVYPDVSGETIPFPLRAAYS